MSTNEIEAALQQMLDLLSSQASDHLSSDHFQQQHDMAEATDSDEGVQQLVESSEATDSDESATIPRESFVRSHEERTQNPRSPHSYQQQINCIYEKDQNGIHTVWTQPHVEDDEVTLDMKKMIQDCGDSAWSSPQCCIYKVPPMLRQLNEEAYTPKLVSVGPFHYGKERLQDMERHKQIMFKKFTHRARSSLDDLVHFVKPFEPTVRASYSNTFKQLTEHQLVKLTLTDAGFIIQLFIMFHERHELCTDAKLSLPIFDECIVEDLLLLENQLPFFVIEQLFNKAFPHDNRNSLPSFLEVTYEYFDGFKDEQFEPNDDVKINHFTDLLRIFYLNGHNPTRRQTIEAGRDILPYSANALKEKGIKLEKSDSNCLLDMKFSRNILEIPQILVGAGTKRLFRNMIALEQCHYPDHAHISDFALVLDCLIDTSKDVEVLVSKKIVRNYLGDSNEVASLLNGLGGNITRWDFNSEYLDICNRLNAHCKARLNRYKATLKRDYCSTPWHIVVSIAGIVVILLTVVQTIISIHQVGK